MAASTEKATYSSAASTGSSSMAASTGSRIFEDSTQLMGKETSESSTPSLTIGGSRIFVAGIEQEAVVQEEKPRFFTNTDGGYLM